MGAVKLGPIGVSTPNPFRAKMSSHTPEPGRVSTCQKKLMGPVTAPVGLVALTLSASVMSAADTVTVWPTSAGVVSPPSAGPPAYGAEPGYQDDRLIGAIAAAR